MKKLVSVLSTLAMACALSAPMFAKSPKSPKPAKAQAAAATTTTTQKAKTKKSHSMHSKKNGTTAGKKMGQTSTTPAPATK